MKKMKQFHKHRLRLSISAAALYPYYCSKVLRVYA